ncbi:MAG: hypothetical protein RSD14_02450 [Clostridia bacterium]
MKLVDIFDDKQKEIFRKAKVELKDKNYNDEEIIEISDAIVEYFMNNGINHDEVNEIGKICESIMDIFGNI